MYYKGKECNKKKGGGSYTISNVWRMLKKWHTRDFLQHSSNCPRIYHASNFNPEFETLILSRRCLELKILVPWVSWTHSPCWQLMWSSIMPSTRRWVRCRAGKAQWQPGHGLGSLSAWARARTRAYGRPRCQRVDQCQTFPILLLSSGKDAPFFP